MSGHDILIVSERLMLIDALAATLVERLGVSVEGTGATDVVRRRLESDEAVTIIVDLESPGVAVDEFAAFLGVHVGRRCGVYDRFTARIAQRAFDLGIRAPIALQAPVDMIVETVGGNVGTAVTLAVGPTRRELEALATLSPRELQVLQAIAAGHSTVRIATMLRITEHTVDTHRRRALRKLEVPTQAQAVGLMARAGGMVRHTGDQIR